jgi:CHAD domain-containing protein
MLVELEAYHSLRLACKKLRYTAESMAPAFPPRAANRYISLLAQMQKSLGGLNDAAVASLRLDSLPPGRAERARTVVKRHLQAVADNRLDSLAVQWAAFCEAKPFWTR